MLEILLISAGAVLETLFIMRSYKRRDASSVVLKTMASVVFVLLGLLELRRMGPSLYRSSTSVAFARWSFSML